MLNAAFINITVVTDESSTLQMCLYVVLVVRCHVLGLLPYNKRKLHFGSQLFWQFLSLPPPHHCSVVSNFKGYQLATQTRVKAQQHFEPLKNL